jgi:hypothetical protein
MCYFESMARGISIRALLLAGAAATSFACSDSDTQNIDGGDEELDAPITTADARVADAPLVEPDADTGEPVDASTLDTRPVILYDADLTPDAQITDAFVVGDAGQTATRSFRFTVDTDGLRADFVDPGIAAVWRGDDGDPPGSLSFTATQGGTIKVITPVAFSWEAWGVPPGATAVYLRLVGYKHRVVAAENMGHSWAFEIVGSNNQTVVPGENGAYLEFLSLDNTPTTEWQTVGDLPAYEIIPRYRASNTELYIKVWWFPMLTGSIEWRLDEIELEVTYVMP